MREYVNMEEFRKTSPIHFQFKVEPSTEQVDTLLGKQLQLQNILQYVGKQLKRDDIGKLLKEAPFGNFKEAFDDFTLDYEASKNEMLALERGQPLPMNTHVDPKYMAARLDHRMGKPDFMYLDPMVQNAYRQRLAEYDQLIAEQEAKILAAQSEY